MKIRVTALYGCGMCVAPRDWQTQGVPRPYRLYYVLGGDARYSVGGEWKPLLRGHVYLFPSSMPFIVSQNSESRLNHLYYDFMISPSVISADALVCRDSDHPLLYSLLGVMKESVSMYRYGGDSGGERLFDAVVLGLEAFLSLYLEIAKPTMSLDGDIIETLEYIEGHYSEDISVKGIARALYLDEDYFIRKFKRNLGITPYAYIKNLRMAVARELRYGGETLKNSSLRVGFKHASSYCRALKGRSADKRGTNGGEND